MRLCAHARAYGEMILYSSAAAARTMHILRAHDVEDDDDRVLARLDVQQRAAAAYAPNTLGHSRASRSVWMRDATATLRQTALATCGALCTHAHTARTTHSEPTTGAFALVRRSRA